MYSIHITPRKVISIITFVISTQLSSVAQQKTSPANWQNLDLSTDHVFGISTEKAYAELLKGKTPQPVIVAVIDGGVDIHHEDLKEVIWTNQKEIPDNHKDDEHNHYIDDVHGWNFLGSSTGSFHYDNAEWVRELRAALKTAPDSSSTKELEYNYGIKRNAMIGALNRRRSQQDGIKLILNNLGKENPTLAELKDYRYRTESEENALIYIVNTMQTTGQSFKEFKAESEELYHTYQHQVDNVYNVDYDPRANKEYNNPYHGNSDVVGVAPTHGTHISGIIAASRTNQLGIKGVADAALIMPISAVPEGDLWDEDMARAIRYAADNGAKIINISINKSSSPGKSAIDAAVKYAMQQDVLIVHAAGNVGMKDDTQSSFPNRNYASGGEAKAWIEVGASNIHDDETLQAPFSNYGKKSVDVFAPGVLIYSTYPNNEYRYENGTSMAAPIVAGLAAMLRSYYPALSAEQIKYIILTSVSKVQHQVKDPSGNLVSFLDSSLSGGIVNAYQAIKMAQDMKTH